MILNFKERFPWGAETRFEAKIKGDTSRTKIHTIRLDPNDRWKSGRLIHFSVRVRTKRYKCFRESVCRSTQTIEIVIRSLATIDRTENKVFKVKVDGHFLSPFQIDLLATNDGFDSTEDFFRYFNKSQTMKLIHWTDLRY